MAIRDSVRECCACLFLFKYFVKCTMLRFGVTLAVLGCVLAVPAPRAQHQYQPQQVSDLVLLINILRASKLLKKREQIEQLSHIC